jgi:hypothetical protein
VDTIRPISVDTSVANNVLRNATIGGDEALFVLLARLGDEADRPELAKAPVVFWGWSASANFGTTFAERHPDRTVAVVRYHTHLRDVAADISTLRQIPILLIAGGRDTQAGTENAEELWQAGRKVGAPWTFAVEPQAEHLDEPALKASEGLLVPWIAAVISQRVSAEGRLRPLSERDGWLGNHETGTAAPSAQYADVPTRAAWLPNEDAARAWQVLIGKPAG